jgi:hypothetical protein
MLNACILKYDFTNQIVHFLILIELTDFKQVKVMITMLVNISLELCVVMSA